MLLDSGATSHNFIEQKLADIVDPGRTIRKKVNVIGEYALKLHLQRIFHSDVGPSTSLLAATTIESKDIFLLEILAENSGLYYLQAYPSTDSNDLGSLTISGSRIALYWGEHGKSF